MAFDGLKVCFLVYFNEDSKQTYMLQPSHHNRSPSCSTKEWRLLCKQAQSAPGSPENPNNAPENAQEQRDVLKKNIHKPSATPEKKTELDEGEVRGNLEALERRTEERTMNGEVEKSKEPEQANATPTQTPTPMQPLSTWGKVKKGMKDNWQEFKDADWKVKTGYIVGGFAGFIAARWLWRKIAGDGENEGWFRKSVRSLAYAGGAVGGYLGIKSIVNYFSNPNNPIPPIVAGEAADAAGGIAKGAGGKLAQTGGEVSDVVKKDAKFWIDLFQKENVSDAMKQVADEGGALALENGAVLLHIGTQAIALPIEATAKIISWIATGKRDEDFWIVYGASGAAYVMGQKTFNLLVRGEWKTLIPLTKKDIALTALKIASGPLGAGRDLLSTTVKARNAVGREALMLRYGRQSLAGKVWSAFTYEKFSGSLKTPKKFLAAVEHYERLERDCVVMRNFSQGATRLFSETELQARDFTRSRALSALQDAAGKFRGRADVPELVKRIADVSALSQDKFGEAVLRARNDLLGGVKGTFSETLRASTKAAEIVSKNPLDPKLAKLLEDSPEFSAVFIKHLETAKDPTKLIRAMNSAVTTTGDTALIGNVMKTEAGFARVVSDVEKGTDVAKVFSSASKISRIGRTLKSAGRMLPVAADALGIYGTVMEMMETSEHIAELRKKGKVREDVIRLEEQRSYYQYAQLGVSGVGLGAGGLALAGIGTAAAGPVALATLPVSAVIYGAYEGHKWKETQERTEGDWKNEFDLVTLLTDARTYDVGERVGHAWALANPNGYDLFLPPVISIPTQLYRVLSGELQKDAKGLIEKIQTVDERKLRAVVAHTTNVSIPTSVRGEDGKERPLTAAEVTQYQTSLTQYVDAKVAFLLSHRQDTTHPIRSNGDIAELLEVAESAGLLAKDTPELQRELTALDTEKTPASRKRAAAIRSVLEEKNVTKQAKAYGKFMQQEQAGTLYTTALMQLAMQAPEKQETLHDPIRRAIAQSLLSASQHSYINFCVQCEESNLVDWFPDSDAQRITRLYASEKMHKMANEQCDAMLKVLLTETEDPTAQGEHLFRLAMQESLHDIERFLSHPKAVWEHMPAEAKARLGYKFVDPKGGNESSEFGERIHEGELLMHSIDANYNGTYYTKQFGWIGNQFLYMSFNSEQGKWLASLGSNENPKDPATFSCNMWGGSEKYNQLLASLVAINNKQHQ